MPADRWNWIKGIAITDEVEAAIGKQERGERLTEDERKAINDANAIINSEIRGWERGEPWDRDEPTPEATPEPTGTPTPGSPEMPPSPPPTATEAPIPADQLPPYGPATGPVWGPQYPPAEGDLDTPGQRPVQTTLNPIYPGEEPPAPPPSLAPPAATPPSAPGTAPPSPPPGATAAPPKPATPPARTAPLNPSYPSEGQGGQPGTSVVKPPAAAAPKAPPKSIAPPAPAAPPPPPFERDETGALLPRGRLTGAISQAGGRPTQRVAERVAREIGEVFRSGDQGGWRGDTGGWRTLAHAAANAWREQYETNPNSLDPRERAAFEKNPDSLHQTILQPDSPFRNYRESWIGATRVGQGVPQSGEFVGDLGRYGVPRPTGISNTTDRGGVPREMTPASNTRQGAPLPGTPGAVTPPGVGSTPGGTSPASTPPETQIDLSEFGAVPESELRPGAGINVTGGVPESELRTPASNTRQGAPLDGATVIDISPPPNNGQLTPDSPYVSYRNGRAYDDRVAMAGGGSFASMRSEAPADAPRPMRGMPSWAATANPDAGRRVGEGRGRDVALRLWQNAYEIGGGDPTFADVIVGIANGEAGFSGRKDARGATGLFQMDPAGGQQQLDRYLQEHGVQMSRDQAAGDVDIMSDFYVRKLHGAYERARDAGYTTPDDLVVQTAIYQWDPVNEPGAAHNAGIDGIPRYQKNYTDGLHEFRQGVFRMLDPRLSETDRHSDPRMALMQSDANQPWPEPAPRARAATQAQATEEIVDQGKAEGRSNREIAETLEMAGYGDADEWQNALDEEDMRSEERIRRQYPPNDGSAPLSTDMPYGEERYYSPQIDVGAPWADPGDELPINYDEDGYPIFRSQEGGDYTTAEAPSYYEEQPSYYEEEPAYAEEQPQYEDEDQGEVAYEEPSYDYSDEYEYEYA